MLTIRIKRRSYHDWEYNQEYIHWTKTELRSLRKSTTKSTAIRISQNNIRTLTKTWLIYCLSQITQRIANDDSLMS